MPIKDQDKADELPFDATRRPTDAQTPKGAQTTRENTRLAPKEETQAKPPPRVSSDRIKDAYQLGGVWYAADGSLLTAPETQQAHRAADAAAAEARRKALLGRSE